MNARSRGRLSRSLARLAATLLATMSPGWQTGNSRLRSRCVRPLSGAGAVSVASVEIAAGDFHDRAGERRLPDFLGDQVDDALLDLEPAGDAEQRGGAQDDGVAGEHLLPDDEVDEAGLVLEGHE